MILSGTTIVIDNPSAGNYSVLVNGNTIPFGPQDYFISYEFIIR